MFEIGKLYKLHRDTMSRGARLYVDTHNNSHIDLVSDSIYRVIDIDNNRATIYMQIQGTKSKIPFSYEFMKQYAIEYRDIWNELETQLEDINAK